MNSLQNQKTITALFIFAALSSCGKNATKNEPTTSPQDKADKIETIQILNLADPVNRVLLHKDIPSSFTIKLVEGTYKSPVTFSFKCLYACLEGLSLSGQGEVSWVAPQNADYSSDDTFAYEIKVHDAEGSQGSAIWRFNPMPYEMTAGNEWSKKEPKLYAPDKISATLQTALLLHGADGRAGGSQGGSIVYLGKLEDKYYALTARHVIESVKGSGYIVCDRSRTFFFEQAHVTASCASIVYISDNLDFALMELAPKKGDLDLLKDHDIPFTKLVSSGTPALGSPFAILGYGRLMNPYGKLTLGLDDDCMSYTKDDEETQFPRDIWNSETKKYDKTSVTLKLRTAPCEASPGDSGGAVLDMASGKIAGLVFGLANDTKKITSEEIKSGLNAEEKVRQSLTKVAYTPSDLIVSELKQIPSDHPHYDLIKKITGQIE
jgi:hypothetical protein